MALKVTMKVAGQDVVIEGDSLDVIATMRAFQSGTAPAADTSGKAPAKKGPASRTPRGENGKLALQALAAAGQHGVKQASVQRWMIRQSKQGVAVSSVRHALTQMQVRGFAMRTGDVWRISGNGVKELARLEEVGRNPASGNHDLI